MHENHHILSLTNRKLFTIAGADATNFLQGLITTDVHSLPAGALYPGALLSPQGKILFDFLIAKLEQDYYIDIAEPLADAFLKKLLLYRLRQQVTITPIFAGQPFATSLTQPASSAALKLIDARFAAQPPLIRYYAPPPSNALDTKAWHALCIVHGLAEGGSCAPADEEQGFLGDFRLRQLFPHDINYDQIGGVSFTKGCYIGQEVVARMQHRGTARWRTLIATSSEQLASGATLYADKLKIGQLGRALEQQAIAFVRIDRLGQAQENGIEIYANQTRVQLRLPPNVDFAL